MRHALRGVFVVCLAAAPGLAFAQPSPQAACTAGQHAAYPGWPTSKVDVVWQPDSTRPGAYYCSSHRMVDPRSPTILMDFTLEGTRDRVRSLLIVGQVIGAEAVPVAFRKDLEALSTALITALGGSYLWESTLPTCLVTLCSRASFSSNIGEGKLTEHIEDETRDSSKVYQYTIQIELR